MSLKDRLNSQSNVVVQKEIVKNEPKEKRSSIQIKAENNFGLLDSFFVDENLNSIYVSGAKNIYIEKNGTIRKITSAFKNNSYLTEIIRNNALKAGVENSENLPFLKFNYKEGVNVYATLPPVSNKPVMKITCYYVCIREYLCNCFM